MPLALAATRLGARSALRVGHRDDFALRDTRPLSTEVGAKVAAMILVVRVLRGRKNATTRTR